MSSRSRISIAVAVLILVLASSSAPLQQTQDAIYFDEYGHWVSGEFLDFFQQSPDPLTIIGLPITRVFPHPLRPEISVQYFQRARMELDPSAPPGQRVKLAPLGTWIYDETSPSENANIDTTNASCRFFEATGHSVCFAFMQFYESNQGAIYFGQPISEVELSGGRFVQYFENARMEWRAERPVNARVTLTDLGSIDFDRQIGNPDYTKPEDKQDPNIPVSVLRLIVQAFPSQPIVQANTTQHLNIIVQNQLHQPVKGALVTVTIHRPDGATSVERLNETNSDGFTQVEIPVGDFAPNQVFQIEVTGSLREGPSTTTSSWFRIWW